MPLNQIRRKSQVEKAECQSEGRPFLAFTQQ
jgi:hypothetical protein